MLDNYLVQHSNISAHAQQGHQRNIDTLEILQRITWPFYDGTSALMCI